VAASSCAKRLAVTALLTTSAGEGRLDRLLTR
jgi:hypothetical protein